MKTYRKELVFNLERLLILRHRLNNALKKAELRKVFYCVMQCTSPQVFLLMMMNQDYIMILKYFSTINEILRPEDYLFFDINEKTLDFYILELLILKEEKNNYNLILTYSPRPREVFNGHYSNKVYTNIINNISKREYETYNFSGISDYAGLKDELPTRGGSSGCALGLFYNYKKDQYFSIVNNNRTKGVRGYKDILKVLKEKEVINEIGNEKCLEIDYINDNLTEEKSGNWATWKDITALRVLSEKKKVYKD